MAPNEPHQQGQPPQPETSTQSTPGQYTGPLSTYASGANADYALETLEVSDPSAPKPTNQSSKARASSLQRATLGSVSSRRAAIVSLSITLVILAISALSLSFLLRQSPDDQQSIAGPVPSQDIVIPGEPQIAQGLEGEAQSLLVNGDILTKGNLKVTSGDFYSVIQSQTLSDDQTISLPNASGVICLDANNCDYASTDDLAALQGQINAIEIPDINLADIPDAGVTTVNGQDGALTIQGTSNRISVSLAGNTITIATPQNIATGSSPTFANLRLSGLTNGFLQVNGTGQLSVGVIDLGTDTNGSYVASFTAGNGLTGDASGEGSTPTLNIVSANGGIVVNPNDITLTLQTNKGLEVDGNGLSLVDCADGEILKYETTGGTWQCDTDAGAGGSGDSVQVNSVNATDANFINTTADATTAGTTFSLNTASSPDEITLTISAASAVQAGMVTANAQGFGGDKTFSGQIIANGNISSSGALNITPGGALTVGSTTQTALLQGSTTSITSTGIGNDITLSSADALIFTAAGNITLTGFNCSANANGGTLTTDVSGNLACADDDYEADTDTNTTYSAGNDLDLVGTTFNIESQLDFVTDIVRNGGNLTLSTTTSGNVIINSAGTIELQDNTNITGNLNATGNADFAGTLTAGTADAFQVDASGNVSAAGLTGTSLNVGAGTITSGLINGQTISATANFTGTLNVATSLTTPTLSLGAASTTSGAINLFNSASAFGGTLNVDALGQATTFTLPDPGQATADICLSTGNCAGAGGGITGSGTAGTLPYFNTSSTLADSVLSQSGGNLTATGNATLQGGTLTLGVASTTAGQLNFYNSSNSFLASLVTAAVGQGTTYTLPDPGGATADICLNSGNCLGGGGGAAPADAQYLTLALSGSLTNERLLTPGTSLSITDGGANGNYNINTIQDIRTTASPTFASLDTGQGAYELFAMNQDVETTDAVQFAGLTLTGNLQMNANTIQGTTAVIDFTNFDVAGNGNTDIGGTLFVGTGNAFQVDASGNIVGVGATLSGDLQVNGGDIGIAADTDLIQLANGALTVNGSITGSSLNVGAGTITSGLINGQTISSSANFTGTVNVASTATVQGATLTVGTSLTNNGSLVLLNATNAFNVAISGANQTTGSATISFPDTLGVDDTFCLETLDNCSATPQNTFSTFDAPGGTDPVADSATDTIALANGTNITITGDSGTDTLTFAVVDNPTFSGLLTANGGIDLGTQTLQGTTAIINFNNFDVAANGNITTAGDVAINGGDLTTTGVLNITPGGALTVGSTTQTALLQGSTTSITSTGAGNDITLNSADALIFTAAGNITLTGFNCSANANGGTLTTDVSGNLACADDDYEADTDTNTTYSAGNDLDLVGTTFNIESQLDFVTDIVRNGGNLTLSTTTSGNVIINSAGTIELQDNTNITGNLNATGNADFAGTLTAGTADAFQVDASGNVSAAGLTGTSLNVGAGTITSGLINGQTISATANFTGTLNVATSLTTPTLSLGAASTTSGAINLFNSASAFGGTLNVDALGQATTFTLPDPGQATADICLSTGNCAGAGGGITGSGTAGTLPYFNTSSTLADSVLSQSGGNLTATGNATLQGGTLTLGVASTTAGQLNFYNSSNSFLASLVTAAVGQGTTYTLPDPGGATADICLNSGNCLGGGGGAAPADAQYLTLALSGSLTNERLLTPGTSLSITDGGANGNYNINTIQDIRTAASPQFTGLTLTGDLAVNGQDITSTTSLNVTASAGSLTFTSTGIGSDIVLSSADAIRLTGFNCTTNTNGGTLTTDASGNITCSDDDFQADTNTTYTAGNDIDFSGTQIDLEPQLDFVTDIVRNGGNLTLSTTTSGNVIINSAGTIELQDNTNVTGNLGVSGNATITGGTTTLGAASGTAGSLLLYDGQSAGSENTVSIQAGLVTTNATVSFPTTVGATDTFCLATLANCAGSSQNLFETIATPAGTSPVADSGTDTLSLAVTGTNLTVTGDSVTDTITFDISEATLAGAGLVANGNALDIASGNGGIVVNANDITLTVLSSADALSTTTSSGSGLEVLASGIGLLQGCANNEILKWNETTDVWQCAPDADTNTTYTAGNDIDFSGTQIDLEPQLDFVTDIVRNGGNLTLSTTTSGNVIINSAGTIELQDNTNVTGNLGVSGNATITGGTTTLGAASGTAGSLLLYDGQSAGSENTVSIQAGLVTTNATVSFPTTVGATDTFCLATLANCAGSSQNLFETIATPAGTSPVADSGTDTLSLAVTGTNLTVTGDSVTDTITFDISEATLAGAGLVANGNALDIASGNGGIVVNANDITLTVLSSADALSTTTSSGSGLEVLASGIGLLQGCANNEILKWNETTDVWQCAPDADTNTTYTAGNDIDFSGTQIDLEPQLDFVTDIVRNGGNLTLSTTTSGNVIINSAGTIELQDNTNVTGNLGVSGNATITGGTTTLGAASGTAGSLLLYDGQSAGSENTVSIQAGLVTTNATVSFPTTVGATDTFCLATLANCAGSSQNLFETIATPAGTSPVADSGTDTLSLAVTGTNLTVTGDSVTDTITFDISEATLAGAGLVANGNALDIASGNGGIVVNANDITLTVLSSADALSTTTSSGSGLEVLASGIGLLQGCANNEILKWNETTDVWQCAPDADTNTTYTAGNDIDFSGTQIDLEPQLDFVTDIVRNGGNLTLSTTTSGNVIINSAGTIELQDNTNVTGNLGVSGNATITGGTTTLGAASGTAGSLLLYDGQSAGSENTVSIQAGLVTTNATVSFPTTVGATDTFCLATLANCAGSSQNLFETIATPAGTSPVADSGTDTLSLAVTGTNLTVTGDSVTDTITFDISEATLAGAGLVANGNALDIASGNGGIVVNANDITLTVLSSADALSTTTSSGSGLEVLASGIGLLQGCANNEILKWNETTDVWQCAPDADTNTTYTAGNDIDFSGTQIDLEPQLDFVTDIVRNGGNLTLSTTTSGNVIINSAGTIELQDNTNVTGNLGVSGNATITGGTTTLGAASGTAGSLLLYDGQSAGSENTVSIQAGLVTTNATVSFPTTVGATDTFCLATLANCAGSSQNLFETIATPAGTSPVADSGTDTLSLAVTGTNLTVTGDSVTDTITFDISEATLAGAGLVANGNALDIASGNGGIVVNANDITLTVLSSADALSTTTSSGSGLEVLASGIGLLQGCANNEILKWNETTDVWQCAPDADTNTTYTAGNDIDFSGTQIDLEPQLDFVTDIVRNGGNLTLSTTTSGNVIINSAGTIELQDNTNVTGNLGVSGNATITGGTTTLGAASGTAGSLLLYDGQSAGSENTVSIQAGLVTTNATVSFPTTVGATDTFCLATLANCAGSSQNLFETIATPAGTSPVADSGTDTLSLAVTGTNLTVTGDSVTDTITFDISEATLAGAGLVANGNALDIASGNGGIVVNANDITLTVLSSADALSTTTSSGSGLEVLASGIGLLQGCANNEILKWNETTDVWQCAPDADTNTTYTAGNDIDFSGTQIDLEPQLDFVTDIVRNGGNLTLSTTTSGNVIINSAGTIELQDNTNVTGNLGVSGNATITGGTTTLGAASGTAGSLLLYDGQSAGSENTVSIQAGLVTTNATVSFPTTVGATDTFCLATLANCAGSSQNLFETIATPAGTSPVADSGTDTLSLAVTGTNLTVTGDSVTDTITFDISEATLAGAGLVANGNALDIASGNGGIVVNANDITLTVLSSADALSTTTSSGSGLEVLASGIGLLQGCANNEILKWNETTDVWQCAPDADTNTTYTAGNDIDFSGTQIDLEPQLDFVTDIVRNGGNLTLSTTTSGNVIINSAGTIELQDNTNVTGNLDTSGTLTAGTADAFQVSAAGVITAGSYQGTQIADAYVSDTLTSSLFVGSGSTTTAIDLATAEVAGTLPVARGGTGATTLTDLITLGTHTTGNYLSTLSTGNGLTGSASSEGATPTINLAIQANKGLEVDVNGLSLIDCSTNQVLKYNGSNQWACASDDGGSGGTVDTTGTPATNQVAYFSDTDTIQGSSAFTFDGTDLTVGTTSAAGDLVLHDGNGQTTRFTAGDTAGNLTFTFPTAYAGSNNQCLKGTTGGVLSFSNCNNGSGSGGEITLQDAYDASTTPEITVDATRGALTIRDNSTPIAANLFEVTNNALSTTYFGVDTNGATVTGNFDVSGTLYAGTSDAFQVSSAGQLLFNGVATDITTGTNETLTVVANGTGIVHLNDTVRIGSLDCSGNGNGGKLTTSAGGNIICADDNGGAGAGFVDTTGTPATNQVAYFSDADTIQGSANFTFNGTTLAITANTNITGNLDVSGTLTAGTADAFQVSAAGVITAGSYQGTQIADAYVSDTLTSSLFVGSGSTTTAIDLATAEVAGTLPVARGGTGATTLTSGGILYGNGTGAITNSGVLTNGQLLIGDGSGAPTVATLTQGAGITVTNGAGSITIASTLGTSVDLASEVTGTLPIANGGTGATTSQGAINAISQLTTNGDILYHNGTNSTRLARGTNGQCLTSNASTLVWGSCSTSNSFVQNGNSFTADAVLGTNDAFNLSLETAGSTRLTFDQANSAYFGNGITNATPSGFTLRVTGESGTDQANTGNLIIAGGQGTGTGAGSDIIFQTAAASTTGSSLNSLAERLRITSAGNVGIGITAPNNLLHISGANGSTNALARIGSTAVDSVANLAITNDARNWQIKVDGLNSDAFAIRDATAGSDRLIIDASGNTALSGDLQVNGGDIGIAADTDLLQLASGAVTVNGTVAYTAGSASNDAVVCRNGSGQLATCNSTFATTTDLSGYATTSLNNIASTNLSAALNVTSGNLNLTTTTTGNIVLNSAGTIELQDNTNITGNLDVSGTLTAGTADAFQVSAAGVITAGSYQGTQIADAYVSDTLTSSLFVGSGSTTTAIDLATAEVAGTLPVARGGTGATTLTSGGILYGNGTGAITNSGVLTNGQLLIGDGSGAPTVATLTQGAGITVTNGAGSITIASTLGTSVDLASEVTGTLPIANGGTGATTSQGAINAISQLTTNGDILYHNGTNSTRLARGTNGQCLTSNATTLVWASCGGGGTLQSAYTASSNPEITLDATRGALTIRDASTPLGANLLEVQNNGGTATYFGVTANGVTLQDGSANTAFTFDSSTSRLRVYENVSSPTNYAELYYASGEAVFQASSGTTRVGAGTGNITLSTSGSDDIIISSADQVQLTGFNCTTFTNGGTLTTDVSGNISCANDDGGAGGTVTETGTNVSGQIAYFTSDTNITSNTGFTFDGSNLNVLGTGTNSLQFGSSANAAGIQSTAIGRSSTASGTSGVSVGYQASSATGIALGATATSTGNGIAIGGGASATANYAIGLGANTNVSHVYAIGLGFGATTTSANQLVVGGSTGFISSAYFGSGVTHTAPSGFALRVTGESGADQTNTGHLTIAGGQGTGTGAGSNIIFQYSPAGATSSSLNALQTACTISGVNGSLSCPGTGTDSERFGAGSTASSNRTLAVGSNATAGALQSTVIGRGATDNGTSQSAVVIGYNAQATGSLEGAIAIGESSVAPSRGVAIGLQSNSSTYGVAIGTYATSGSGNLYNVAIGNSASSLFANSIALGSGATTTASSQLVVADVTSGYFGNGVTNATPSNFTLNATGGSGTNIAGANLLFAGGRGTGTGVGGDIILQTASAGSTGASLNSLTERLRVTSEGRVGIGNVTPSTSLVHIANNNGIGSENVLLLEQGSAGNGAQLMIATYSSDSAGEDSQLTFRRARGTSASPSAVLSGDNVGEILATGYDTDFSTGASILFQAAADWGTAGDASDAPTHIIFGTAADGSQGATERMRITSGGTVGIGTTTPNAQSQLDVFGNFTGAVAGSQYGTKSYAQFNTADTGWKRGLQSTINTFHTTGTQDRIIGIESVTNKGNTGIVNDAIGIFTSVNNVNATGVINNAYGLYIGDSNETGTITNDYGLYQADTGAQNYFGGSLGIGTTSSSLALAVNGATELYQNLYVRGALGSTTNQIRVHNNNSDSYVDYNGGGLYFRDEGATNTLTILPSGDIGINDGTPSAKLDINGTLYTRSTHHFVDQTSGSASPCFQSAGGFASSIYVSRCSSLRENKNNIQDLNIGLDELLQLRPREFDWRQDIDGGKHDLGFIAEEVEAVAPILAEYNENKGGALQGVKYKLMSSLIIKSIQELNSTVQSSKLKANTATSVNNTQNSKLNSINNTLADIESDQVVINSGQDTRITKLEQQSAANTNELYAISQELLLGQFSDLNVSGTARIEKLEVAGDTTTTNLTVTGTAIIGHLEVTDNLSVQKNLTVAGDTFVQNLYVNGKLISQGEVPQAVLSAVFTSHPDQQAVAGSEVVVEGNDTAGSIRFKTTVELAAEDVLGEITFNKAYDQAPRITLTATNSNGAKYDIYVTRDASGFKLVLAEDLPANTELTFDYQVIQ